MTLTIKNAEDAYLYGRASFEEWQEQFMQSWFAPIGVSLMAAIWQKMTPEEHAALRQLSPQAYDVIDQQVGGANAVPLP